MEYRQRTGGLAMDGRRRIEKAAIEEHQEPRYHVYVRLPFNRGDFVDPGTVNWNEKKSEAFWSILSGSSAENFNWTRLATQFDVSVDFLLQMANYLTERHTTQLRAQMLKAAAFRGSNGPSPAPGADDPARRTASAAGRAPSSLSIRKDAANQLPRTEEEPSRGAGINAPGLSARNTLPSRPGSSRNSSGNTAIPSQSQPASRPETATRLSDPQRRRLSYLPTPPAQQQQVMRRQQPEEGPEIAPPSPARSTSSSSSSSDSPVESRIIRRPPRFQTRDPRVGGGNGRGPFDDDDDDDDEPAFLPLKPQSNPVQGTRGSSTRQDLGATLRGNMRDLAIGRRTATDGNQSQTSDSSAGSAAIVLRRPSGTAGGTAGHRRLASGNSQQQDPLSPRRTADLAGRAQASAASRTKGSSRDGSDGTPSMGSSFSDLDDTSVTQSALEEALASRMQDGTIGSRMSVLGGTIGQAFRSRYLPKSNR